MRIVLLLCFLSFAFLGLCSRNDGIDFWKAFSGNWIVIRDEKVIGFGSTKQLALKNALANNSPEVINDSGVHYVNEVCTSLKECTPEFVAAMEHEKELYEAMKPKLHEDFEGRWVLLKGGNVIAVGSSPDETLTTALSIIPEIDTRMSLLCLVGGEEQLLIRDRPEMFCTDDSCNISVYDGKNKVATKEQIINEEIPLPSFTTNSKVSGSLKMNGYIDGKKMMMNVPGITKDIPFWLSTGNVDSSICESTLKQLSHFKTQEERELCVFDGECQTFPVYLIHLKVSTRPVEVTIPLYAMVLNDEACSENVFGMDFIGLASKFEVSKGVVKLKFDI